MARLCSRLPHVHMLICRVPQDLLLRVVTDIEIKLWLQGSMLETNEAYVTLLCDIISVFYSEGNQNDG